MTTTKATTTSVKNALQQQIQTQQVTPQNDMSFQGVLTKQLQHQFKAIQSLVPKHVTPERLCRIGLNAASRNPQLLSCTPETIVGAIVNCATLGLEPNLLGHAYIVPFWNNKSGKMEAQFQVGYKGALDLIRRTGAVSTISAHEVYEGDKFEYSYGLEEKLIHIPSGEDDEAKITHFYGCYKLKDGGTGFVVMTRSQMEKHRDKFTKSKNKQGEVFGPWKDHYVSMALKTVILKLIKYMPVSIEQQENQTIMEGLQRDNSAMVVKEPNVANFGDAYIDKSYVVNETQVVDIQEEKDEK
ncbi:recombinase RecT [Clostridium sp.]|uniref:recombinase RecT n=1 Tax=Clostridium sp. TaxID=1506 RepID=UPI002FCBFBB6